LLCKYIVFGISPLCAPTKRVDSESSNDDDELTSYPTFTTSTYSPIIAKRYFVSKQFTFFYCCPDYDENSIAEKREKIEMSKNKFDCSDFIYNSSYNNDDSIDSFNSNRHKYLHISDLILCTPNKKDVDYNKYQVLIEFKIL